MKICTVDFEKSPSLLVIDDTAIITHETHKVYHNEREVAECKDGHGPVLHAADKDCPACKEISKRLTEVNALEVKLALKDQQIAALQGTVDSLNAKEESLTPAFLRARKFITRN